MATEQNVSKQKQHHQSERDDLREFKSYEELKESEMPKSRTYVIVLKLFTIILKPHLYIYLVKVIGFVNFVMFRFRIDANCKCSACKNNSFLILLIKVLENKMELF